MCAKNGQGGGGQVEFYFYKKVMLERFSQTVGGGRGRVYVVLTWAFEVIALL